MVLQAMYPEESGIPETYRPLYTKSDDGVWRLSGIEGIRTVEESMEMENAYARDKQELESLKKIFHSIGETPEKLAEFAAEHEQLRNGLSEANAKLESYSEEIRKETIEKALRKAAAAKGIRPEAVSDVLARSGNFDLDGEKKVVFRKDGENLSAEEWLEKQLKNAPHWLAPSRSAGVKGFAGTFNHHYSAPATLAEIISESWNNNKRS